jgi:predicted Ser/Thr protein kinase
MARRTTLLRQIGTERHGETMRELGNALGRFAGGLSNVDELRGVFREYLRAHPERREAVARWLTDSIQIGRLSPAIMLTIGDLVAPPKGSSSRPVPAQAATAKAGPAKAVPAPGATTKAGPAKAMLAQGISQEAASAQGVPAKGAADKGLSTQGVPAKGRRSEASSDLETVFPGRSSSGLEARSFPETTRGAKTQFFAETSSDSEGESVLETSLEFDPSFLPEGASFSENAYFPEDASNPDLELLPESSADSEASSPSETPLPAEFAFFPESPSFPESVPVPQSSSPVRSEPPASRSRSVESTRQTGISFVEATNRRATESAMAAENTDSAKAGDVLDGRYTLVMELGRGGMGSVFKARDRNREDFQARNPYIALKLLSEEFRSHPDARMALQRETERAQSLAHENIVRVFDFDYDGPHAYMTMELLDGQSLEGWLNGPDYERATFARKWSIVHDIGEALVCAHKHGVVHSDLKPANVFLCNSGTVKVMDFGIARPLRDVSSGADTTLFDPAERLGGLTPAYASLEQWNKEAPDPRDDIYAFACVVYHIFAGGHPRGRILSKSDLERCPRPRRIRSLTHLQWDTLRRGLALKRGDRIASVEEFLRDFAPRTWLKRYRMRLWGAGALIIAVLLYFGVQYYQDFEEDQALNAQLWPSVEAPTKPLTQDQRRDIDDYLYLGREALQQAANMRSVEELSALLSKGDNNLLELLRRVRELDPSNAQALKMTAEATHLYENRASVMLDSNRPADSLKLVLEGQNFTHTHELFRLKRAICRRNAALCHPSS